MSEPSARDRLLAAWELWDAEPSNEHRAGALVDAGNDFAGAVRNEMRHHLAAARRAGLSYAAAVDDWENQW